MGWIYLPSVSIQNGSNIVTVNNTATDSIKPGDGLLIGSYDLVEIIEVSIGQLKLKKNWSSANQSNAEAAVVPTFGDFNAATAALRQATTITQGNFAEMEKWWTQLGQVTFKAYNNTAHTVRTAKQMDADVSELEAETRELMRELAALGYVWRTEADMEHMRSANDEMFAASGFVHMGKMSGANGRKTVNEGLTLFNPATENYPNALFLGETGGAKFGASKTNSSVVNIAGFISELVDLGKNWGNCFVKFPEAEAGTRVYDSATGVSIDYAKEIDPKYGNIAPDHNEAVARAFEGDLKNADFRFGNNGSWGGLATMQASSITDGVLYFEDYAASGDSYISQDVHYPDGQEFDVEIDVLNIENGARIYVELAYGGTSSHGAILIDDAGIHKTRLTVPSDSGGVVQIRIRDYLNSGAGISINSIRIKKSTQEVVTERVDMFGFEGWLEQVTPTNPFVYKHGIIQSQATTIDGIVTTSSNRPDSYYAVYDGDTTSRGKGVNFWALSVIEQDAIANNPKNHIYRMKNGDLVQWRIRQLTKKGAGNGDWQYASPWITAALCYQNGTNRFPIQGNSDTVEDWVTSGGINHYYGGREGLAGAFTAYEGVGKARNAYNGLAMFVLVGAVPRLNQGAYHPSLNPFGTGKWVISEASAVSRFWYDGDITVPKRTTKDAFVYGIYGAIKNTVSGAGRPDGKYHDAIYDSGMGGVIDHRLKYGAWDASTAEQAAVVREEVKNGTYRGRESLGYTEILDCKVYANSSSTRIYLEDPLLRKYVSASSDITSLVDIYLENSSGEWVKSSFVYAYSSDPRFYVSGENFPVKLAGDTVRIVFTHRNLLISERITVEGNFSLIDVMGDPVNILQCQALKFGWLGSWIRVIPDGIVPHNQIQLTRQAKNATGTMVYTGDNGSTWTSAAITYDQVLNVRDNSSAPSLGRIAMYIYTASAKQTIPCNKSAVLNGDKGIGMVEVTQSYRTDGYSALLAESLSGKIQTSPNGNSVIGRYGLLSLAMGASGFSESGGWLGDTKHSSITLAAPANNGPAHKFLSYQKESSQQANLGYLWTELVHNGTDWGDDSLIHVADKISQRTDINGNLVLYGTAELAKPYGVIKNKI